MIHSRYLSNIIREDIKKGESLRALIQIATDLDAIFFDKLFFEKKINPNLISGWTLGRKIDWVFGHDLIDKKYEQLIRDFNKVRNAIVHSRYGMYNAVKDSEKSNFLTNLMIQMCDFIDNTYIKKDYDKGISDKEIKISGRIRKKYEDAFKKKSVKK